MCEFHDRVSAQDRVSVSRTQALALCFIIGLSIAASTPARTQAESIPPQAMENAMLLSALTFPTPGEFFAALAKSGRPNLSAAGRVAVPLSISERPRIALVVGLLLADGYLAIENQNSQEMKNIGRDLIEMAKKLNAGEHVVARGRSITDFAENNDWNSLREELEATRNEIRMSLTAQKDPGLSLLVSLGAWLRSIQAGATIVSQQYDTSPAELFRQAALVEAWQRRAAILPSRFLENPWVFFILSQTSDIGKLMEVEEGDAIGAPSEKRIAEIESLTRFIITQLIEPAPGEAPQIRQVVPTPGEAAAETQDAPPNGTEPAVFDEDKKEPKL